MAATNKFLKLMRTLVDRTKLGNARWVSGSRDDTFIWSSASGSIVVFPADHDGQQPWSVRVVDSEGRTLEEEVFGRNDDGFAEAGELYQVARGNALDIDTTIDRMLRDLDT